jgi:hypothetical protein
MPTSGYLHLLEFGLIVTKEVLNLDSKTLIFILKCLGLNDLEMVGMLTIVRSNLKKLPPY